MARQPGERVGPAAGSVAGVDAAKGAVELAAHPPRAHQQASSGAISVVNHQPQSHVASLAQLGGFLDATAQLPGGSMGFPRGAVDIPRDAVDAPGGSVDAGFASETPKIGQF